MKLLTNKIRRQLPPLDSTRNAADPIAYVKLFSRFSERTWYIMEFDGRNVVFGFVTERSGPWMYFSLRELQSEKGPDNLPAIERDATFVPVPISQALKEHDPAETWSWPEEYRGQRVWHGIPFDTPHSQGVFEPFDETPL